MHEEFKKRFKDLTLSFSDIEKSIECPKNYLSRFVNGPQTLPSKWEVKIHQFLALKELIPISKNKATPDYGALDQLLDWRKEVDVFCEKRGWKAEQLIEKFEELEARITEFKAFNGSLSEAWDENKPNTALKDKKQGDVPKKEEMGGKGARNAKIAIKIEHEGVPLTDKEIEQLALNARNYSVTVPEYDSAKLNEKMDAIIKDCEQMPEGLTPIQQAVWRNNQKMKGKAAPITQFGVTKKDKS